MCTTRTVPNVSLSWCICIECETCVSIQWPQLKYFRICSYTYVRFIEKLVLTVRIIVKKVVLSVCTYGLFGTSLRCKVSHVEMH